MPALSLAPFTGNISFNAQHSPMGAFMSITCGSIGMRGGAAAQIGKPANHEMFIGGKDRARLEAGAHNALSFRTRKISVGAGAADFRGDKAGPAEQNAVTKVIPFEREGDKRYIGWATDPWTAEDLEFSVYTPLGSIPKPQSA